MHRGHEQYQPAIGALESVWCGEPLQDIGRKLVVQARTIAVDRLSCGVEVQRPIQQTEQLVWVPAPYVVQVPPDCALRARNCCESYGAILLVE